MRSDLVMRRVAWPLAMTAAFAIAAHAQEAGPPVGTMIESATVQDMRGKDVAIAPGTRPMLVEIWATWCPYCRQLEPTMQKVHAKYSDRVRFAAIAVNVDETRDAVARFSHAHRLTYPVYYDADAAATRAYEAEATSVVVIVGRDGRVAYTGVGGAQDLDAALRRVLDDDRPSPHTTRTR